MGTYTTKYNLYMPTVGEQGWGTLVNENCQKIDTALPVAGAVQLFAGSSAPNGWLICNGQAVSRTTYAALFAVIGTTYGAGDGSTTFNVPNLVNKTVRGSNSLGKTGGADTVTLSIDNLPAHTHDGGSYSALSGGAHTHGITSYSVVGGSSGVGIQAVTTGRTTTGRSTNSGGEHTHVISGDCGSTGSGSAVTITNPYVMLHYIIKT